MREWVCDAAIMCMLVVTGATLVMALRSPQGHCVECQLRRDHEYEVLMRRYMGEQFRGPSGSTVISPSPDAPAGQPAGQPLGAASHE